MHASLGHRRIPIAIIFLVTELACGGRSTEGGAGASGGSAGTSSTGGGSGNGGSGTGGATGATGGSGAAGGLTPGDSGACGCTTGHVGWGMNGGRVAFQETSALEVCNLFLHQRVPLAPDPPGMSCEQQITDCVGRFGPGDVARAITHPDVRAAITSTPVVYGEDARPADGQVMRIQIAGATIDVGDACRTASCKPIPQGVNELAGLLRSITKQELSRSPCSAIFPPPP